MKSFDEVFDKVGTIAEDLFDRKPRLYRAYVKMRSYPAGWAEGKQIFRDWIIFEIWAYQAKDVLVQIEVMMRAEYRNDSITQMHGVEYIEPLDFEIDSLISKMSNS